MNSSLYKKSLTRQTLIMSAIRIAAAILVITFLFYLYISFALQAQVLESLERYTQQLEKQESSIFRVVEDNHIIFAGDYKKRLSKMGDIDPEDRFNFLFTPYEDGTLRIREELFDQSEITGIIGKNILITPDLKRRMILAYEMLVQYGPAWKNSSANLYITIQTDIIIIYWPDTPWGLKADLLEIDAKLALDNTGNKVNKNRNTAWTNLYYDFVADDLLVSARRKLNLKESSISVCSDIRIHELFNQTMYRASDGSYNLVFDETGKIIAHPDFSEDIYTRKGDFSMLNVGNPNLWHIFELTKKNDGKKKIINNVKDEEYLSVNRLYGPGWYFVTVFPKKNVWKKAFETVRFIFFLGVLFLVVEIAILFFVLKKQVTEPLARLMDATNSVASGDFKKKLDINRNDEVGHLGFLFNTMSSEIDTREKALKMTRQELKDINENLEDLVSIRTQELKIEIEKHRLTEKALRESEKKYRILFEKSDDAILIIDGFNFIDCNQSVVRMLGYDNKKQILGRHPSNISPERQLDQKLSYEKAEEMMAKALENGTHHFEWLHKRADNSIFPVEVWLTAIPYQGKQIIHTVWRDITERKKAEEEIQQLTAFQRAILDSANFTIISTDVKGVINSFNSTAERLLGYKADDVVGRQTPLLIHDREEIFEKAKTLSREMKQTIEPGFQVLFAKALKTGVADENEWTYIRKNQTRFPVYLSVTALRDSDGCILGFLGIGQDITFRKQSEMELKKAKEAAESANRAKSEFIANMSHEIRTPINAISGFSEILIDKVEDAEQKRYLKNIQSSGKSLIVLIDDILDLSKIEAGCLEIQPEPVDIVSLLEEIRQVFLHDFTKKELKFILDVSERIPSSVLLDEVRLRQILINLVGNAIKFTAEGYVKVSVYLSEALEVIDEVSLIFEVEDTGIGIPAHQQELIFEYFRQQDGQITKVYGGTGLGLPISRRLAEMMNGTISVESVPGEGSAFLLVLTDVKIVKNVINKQKSFKTDGICVKFEPAVVMLVDDICSNRELIKGYLKKTSLSIIEAGSGEEALALLGLQEDSKLSQLPVCDPDLILMDIKMAGKNGYETTEIIKNNHKTCQIHVIAATASAMKETGEKIAHLFDGCLIKPFGKTELLVELKKHLSHTVHTVMETAESSAVIMNNFRYQTKLSPETIARLPNLLILLTDEFIPQWEDIKDVLIFDEIEEFANQVKEQGEKYRCSSLINWSEMVHCQIHDCDMEKLPITFEYFPEIIKELSSL